ncbi:MAG: hypothetical protein ACI97N_000691 [Cognaticolwellia sp.]|jgi:hypothetical protein
MKIRYLNLRVQNLTRNEILYEKFFTYYRIPLFINYF